MGTLWARAWLQYLLWKFNLNGTSAQAMSTRLLETLLAMRYAHLWVRHNIRAEVVEQESKESCRGSWERLHTSEGVWRVRRGLPALQPHALELLVVCCVYAAARLSGFFLHMKDLLSGITAAYADPSVVDVHADSSSVPHDLAPLWTRSLRCTFQHYRLLPSEGTAPTRRQVPQGPDIFGDEAGRAAAEEAEVVPPLLARPPRFAHPFQQLQWPTAEGRPGPAPPLTSLLLTAARSWRRFCASGVQLTWEFAHPALLKDVIPPPMPLQPGLSTISSHSAPESDSDTTDRTSPDALLRRHVMGGAALGRQGTANSAASGFSHARRSSSTSTMSLSHLGGSFRSGAAFPVPAEAFAMMAGDPEEAASLPEAPPPALLHRSSSPSTSAWPGALRPSGTLLAWPTSELAATFRERGNVEQQQQRHEVHEVQGAVDALPPTPAGAERLLSPGTQVEVATASHTQPALASPAPILLGGEGPSPPARTRRQQPPPPPPPPARDSLSIVSQGPSLSNHTVMEGGSGVDGASVGVPGMSASLTTELEELSQRFSNRLAPRPESSTHETDTPRNLRRTPRAGTGQGIGHAVRRSSLASESEDEGDGGSGEDVEPTVPRTQGTLRRTLYPEAHHPTLPDAGTGFLVGRTPSFNRRSKDAAALLDMPTPLRFSLSTSTESWNQQRAQRPEDAPPPGSPLALSSVPSQEDQPQLAAPVLVQDGRLLVPTQDGGFLPMPRGLPVDALLLPACAEATPSESESWYETDASGAVLPHTVDLYGALAAGLGLHPPPSPPLDAEGLPSAVPLPSADSSSTACPEGSLAALASPGQVPRTGGTLQSPSPASRPRTKQQGLSKPRHLTRRSASLPTLQSKPAVAVLGGVPVPGTPRGDPPLPREPPGRTSYGGHAWNLVMTAAAGEHHSDPDHSASPVCIPRAPPRLLAATPSPGRPPLPLPARASLGTGHTYNLATIPGLTDEFEAAPEGDEGVTRSASQGSSGGVQQSVPPPAARADLRLVTGGRGQHSSSARAESDASVLPTSTPGLADEEESDVGFQPPRHRLTRQEGVEESTPDQSPGWLDDAGEDVPPPPPPTLRGITAPPALTRQAPMGTGISQPDADILAASPSNGALPYSDPADLPTAPAMLEPSEPSEGNWSVGSLDLLGGGLRGGLASASPPTTAQDSQAGVPPPPPLLLTGADVSPAPPARPSAAGAGTSPRLAQGPSTPDLHGSVADYYRTVFVPHVSQLLAWLESFARP